MYLGHPFVMRTLKPELVPVTVLGHGTKAVLPSLASTVPTQVAEPLLAARVEEPIRPPLAVEFQVTGWLQVGVERGLVEVLASVVVDVPSCLVVLAPDLGGLPECGMRPFSSLVVDPSLRVAA